MPVLIKQCCICKEEFDTLPHDAEPVARGRCCKACYTGVVVYQKFNLAGLTSNDYMYNISFRTYGDVEDE